MLLTETAMSYITVLPLKKYPWWFVDVLKTRIYNQDLPGMTVKLIIKQKAFTAKETKLK